MASSFNQACAGSRRSTRSSVGSHVCIYKQEHSYLHLSIMQIQNLDVSVGVDANVHVHVGVDVIVHVHV